MDDRSTKEKLLQASGMKVPQAPPQKRLEQLELMLNLVMDDLKTGSAQAKCNHDRNENMIERLENFTEQKLPAQMARALEATVQKNLDTVLQPLQNAVTRAVYQIESCESDLSKISWRTRLLEGPLIVGLVTALLGAGMVRCTLNDTASEATRYELLGRTVEKRFAQYDGEQQQKLYNWINGVPTPAPKKAVKKKR